MVKLKLIFFFLFLFLSLATIFPLIYQTGSQTRRIQLKSGYFSNHRQNPCFMWSHCLLSNNSEPWKGTLRAFASCQTWRYLGSCLSPNSRHPLAWHVDSRGRTQGLPWGSVGGRERSCKFSTETMFFYLKRKEEMPFLVIMDCSC